MLHTEDSWLLEKKVLRLVMQQNAIRAGISGIINTHDLYPIYDKREFVDKMSHYGKALETALNDTLNNLQEIRTLTKDKENKGN